MTRVPMDRLGDLEGSMLLLSIVEHRMVEGGEDHDLVVTIFEDHLSRQIVRLRKALNALSTSRSKQPKPKHQRVRSLVKRDADNGSATLGSSEALAG